MINKALEPMTADGTVAGIGLWEIGRKALELLASLPEGQRSFNLEAVRPGRWWLV